ncbi:MAG: glycosyltransferase family 2 protein [Bacteroidales bacterium]|nr:glycosyltransferase family 2 protein [Bacteroidales bacterium]
MLEPKVSVIIPCYNQGDYIGETLQSLQSQYYSNWECVVIDDGSTDNTVAVVDDFCQKDSRILLFSKSNGGSASARNFGLTKVSGDYIQFLDADDLLDELKFAKQIEIMECNQLDVSYTDYSFFVSQNTLVPHIRGANLSKFVLLTLWGLGFSVPSHAFMYRTNFIKQNQIGYDETVKQREDWNFHLTVFNKTVKYSRLKGYLGAWYRQNPTGKTSSYLKMQEGNFRFLILKRCNLSFTKQILWTLRLSAELWQWFLRMVKYRELQNAKFIRLFFTNGFSTLLFFIVALLFLPLSSLIIIRRFIKEYICPEN